MSDGALVDASAVVAVVRVEGSEAAGDGSAATEYQLQVEETLKGEAPDRLSVRVPGGGGGPVRLKIYGAPSFRPGERAIVFLQPDAAGGAWRIPHLFLGAFHEVTAGGRGLALRSLAGVREAHVTASGQVATREPAPEPLRDFDAFARWIAARARGEEAAAEYVVPAAEAAQLRSTAAEFTLFEDEDPATGAVRNLRWFEFDAGEEIPWWAHRRGQSGLAGGGFQEIQRAIAAWNDEAQTPIAYRYAGTTASPNSICNGDEFDDKNSIVFDDPRDCLPTFSCADGGILAIGGPWYLDDDAREFQGRSYYPIIQADVLVNSGLACFFAESRHPAKAAQEIYAHELGHTLGIAHACGDDVDPDCDNAVYADALMRAFVHDDGRGARLGADDQRAVQSLYRQVGAKRPAAPAGLTATTPSPGVVTLAWTDNSRDETGFRIEARPLGGSNFVTVASVAANTTSTTLDGLAPGTQYTFRVLALATAAESAPSNEVTLTTLAPTTACVPDDTTLCLGGNRFQVRVAWRTPNGSTGVGHAAPAGTADSGIFWFFEQDNWEMLVKVLDGCAVNQKRWVFFAATTNVEYVVTVIDTQTGAAKQYFNAQGTAAASTNDTGAFAACP